MACSGPGSGPVCPSGRTGVVGMGGWRVGWFCGPHRPACASFHEGGDGGVGHARRLCHHAQAVPVGDRVEDRPMLGFDRGREPPSGGSQRPECVGGGHLPLGAQLAERAVPARGFTGSEPALRVLARLGGRRRPGLGGRGLGGHRSAPRGDDVEVGCVAPDRGLGGADRLGPLLEFGAGAPRSDQDAVHAGGPHASHRGWELAVGGRCCCARHTRMVSRLPSACQETFQR